MKKNILLCMVLSLVVMMSSTALAFGIPGLPGSGGDKPATVNVNVDELTATAKRIIIKYKFSTIAFTSALAESMNAMGLEKESGELMATSSAYEQDYSVENNKKLAKVQGTAIKSLNEAVKKATLTNEQAQSMMDNSALKAGAAGLLNLSIIPDGIKLFKETSDGLKGLSGDPVGNMDAIKKIQSIINVVQYMNVAMPEQEQLHKDYNNTMSEIAKKFGATKPTKEQEQNKANSLIEG